MDSLAFVSENKIAKDKIDHLILEYFIQEGYQDAASSFAKEINVSLEGERSGTPANRNYTKELGSVDSSSLNDFMSVVNDSFIKKPDDEEACKLSLGQDHSPKLSWNYSAIARRKEIKYLILKGAITEAIQKINDYFPTVLDSNNLLHFMLLRLNLIEMIRKHKLNSSSSTNIDFEKTFLNEILTFVRENLINKVTYSARLLKELELTMSLLCFNFDTTKSIEDQKDLPAELRDLFNLSMRMQCYRLVNRAIINLYYKEEEDEDNITKGVIKENQGPLDAFHLKTGHSFLGPKSILLDFDSFEQLDKMKQEKNELAEEDNSSDGSEDESPELSYDINKDENIELILNPSEKNDVNDGKQAVQEDLQHLSLESKLERVLRLWAIVEQRLVDLNHGTFKSYDLGDNSL
ncbi:Piso0_003799 [Millerozyma farinosa CBS 7064]|uniref:Piso0_003799 protein n=1 Tax=Pichia sorbitophila (strain ATCC MYA-4447 / BCRC 22081 / CBS 7064 / NBRC 10061 / NRRL Y-12695) TaxID=559304 RepID=G8Y6M8_PICSO|nr:Piso0_003799 [Millerozyma farinosa CBS 7064]CCE84258.1 Piso0_003799 [Millerozyma farinosa CBS 7064]